MKTKRMVAAFAVVLLGGICAVSPTFAASPNVNNMSCRTFEQNGRIGVKLTVSYYCPGVSVVGVSWGDEGPILTRRELRRGTVYYTAEKHYPSSYRGKKVNIIFEVRPMGSGTVARDSRTVRLPR